MPYLVLPSFAYTCTRFDHVCRNDAYFSLSLPPLPPPHPSGPLLLLFSPSSSFSPPPPSSLRSAEPGHGGREGGPAILLPLLQLHSTGRGRQVPQDTGGEGGREGGEGGRGGREGKREGGKEGGREGQPLLTNFLFQAICQLYMCTDGVRAELFHTGHARPLCV